MAKEKAKQFVTPRGILKFPRITGEADFKFDKERGDYRTKFLLEPDAKGVAEFLKQLDSMTDVAVAAMKEENKKDAKKIVRGDPYTMETDKEGNETGKVEMSFGMKHKITAKKGEHAGKVFLKKPTIFDLNGKPLDQAALKVGGGTVAKISFEVAPEPYFVQSSKQAGITKRLLAVQIIKLVEWGDRNASSFGFGEEEDDSEFPNTGTTATTEAAEESEEEDTTGGDF